MARCEYGKLKNPSGHRRCKKRRTRAKARRTRRGSKVCRYGKLKNPRGKRICKKRVGARRRRAGGYRSPGILL